MVVALVAPKITHMEPKEVVLLTVVAVAAAEPDMAVLVVVLPVVVMAVIQKHLGLTESVLQQKAL